MAARSNRASASRNGPRRSRDRPASGGRRRRRVTRAESPPALLDLPAGNRRWPNPGEPIRRWGRRPPPPGTTASRRRHFRPGGARGPYPAATLSAGCSWRTAWLLRRDRPVGNGRVPAGGGPFPAIADPQPDPAGSWSPDRPRRTRPARSPDSSRTPAGFLRGDRLAADPGPWSSGPAAQGCGPARAAARVPGTRGVSAIRSQPPIDRFPGSSGPAGPLAPGRPIRVPAARHRTLRSPRSRRPRKPRLRPAAGRGGSPVPVAGPCPASRVPRRVPPSPAGIRPASHGQTAIADSPPGLASGP